MVDPRVDSGGLHVVVAKAADEFRLPSSGLEILLLTELPERPDGLAIVGSAL